MPEPASPVTRPRVGHIQFLNCLPLYWGLVHSTSLLELDLRKDTPERLSDALVAGDLDIGPVTLVEYLRHAEELVLLPDIAIGSDGPVLSCVISSPYADLRELDRRTVALGSTSRTTVLLAQMLLEQRLGVHPHYVSMPPELPAMLRESDAAVVIGDPALRATYDAELAGLGSGRPALHVTDLGAAWREWSGLPMVFAVWAARREYAEREPELTAQVHAAFLRSRDLAAKHLGEVAEYAARYDPLPAAALERYFRTLDFTLGERQLAGIRAFAERAALTGAVPARPQITLLGGDRPQAHAPAAAPVAAGT